MVGLRRVAWGRRHGGVFRAHVEVPDLVHHLSPEHALPVPFLLLSLALASPSKCPQGRLRKRESGTVSAVWRTRHAAPDDSAGPQLEKRTGGAFLEISLLMIRSRNLLSCTEREVQNVGSMCLRPQSQGRGWAQAGRRFAGPPRLEESLFARPEERPLHRIFDRVPLCKPLAPPERRRRRRPVSRRRQAGHAQRLGEGPGLRALPR